MLSMPVTKHDKTNTLQGQHWPQEPLSGEMNRIL